MKNTLLLLFISSLININAQVAINTDGSVPDPSSILDIKSTDSGILIPRMTAQQRDNISSPATGLLVYVTDNNQFYYFDGNSWLQVGGNATGDDHDWVVDNDNLYPFSGGNVGIGTTNPTKKLHLVGGFNNLLEISGYETSTDLGRIRTSYANGSAAVNFEEYDDPFILNFRQTDDNSTVSLGFNDGFMGVNVTHPTYAFQVFKNHAWNNMFRFDTGNDDAGRMFTSYSGGSPYINFIEYDDAFVFRFEQTKNSDALNLYFKNGNMGIDVAQPKRKLHISDAMRLEPLSTPPSNPQTGDMYMDDGTNTTNNLPKLRVFDGTNWQECW